MAVDPFSMTSPGWVNNNDSPSVVHRRLWFLPSGGCATGPSGIQDKEGYVSLWNDSISYALRACILIELALQRRIGIMRNPVGLHVQSSKLATGFGAGLLLFAPGAGFSSPKANTLAALDKSIKFNQELLPRGADSPVESHDSLVAEIATKSVFFSVPFTSNLVTQGTEDSRSRWSRLSRVAKEKKGEKPV
ncbi:hypothetical protein B0H13DRAFT_1870300 [Mycena leptocephala]|nr:hypothetical protein B0H13DRAFT_1870300 [Mycena leptocephala]